MSKYTWNGKQYDTIKAIAEDTGVEYGTMRMRIAKGHTCDADVRPIRKAVACTWNGVHYKSMQDAAAAIGVSYATMHGRVAKGHTSDADMPSPGNPIAVRDADGNEYESLTVYAEVVGISTQGAHYRLKRDVIEAIT